MSLNGLSSMPRCVSNTGPAPHTCVCTGNTGYIPISPVHTQGDTGIWTYPKYHPADQRMRVAAYYATACGETLPGGFGDGSGDVFFFPCPLLGTCYGHMLGTCWNCPNLFVLNYHFLNTSSACFQPRAQNCRSTSTQQSTPCQASVSRCSPAVHVGSTWCNVTRPERSGRVQAAPGLANVQV